MSVSLDLEALAQQIQQADNKRPPIERWHPQFSGDLNMRIARDGTWYYLDSEIKRPALVKLFASILMREADEYFLVTPVEKYRIQVDCAPFLAVKLDRLVEQGQQALVFETNVGDRVILDKDHPLWVETQVGTDEPLPMLAVRRAMNALISRNLFYELVDMAELRGSPQEAIIWSCGQSFSLGRL